MVDISIQEIVKEARGLHPEISDAVAGKLSNFLSSDLNASELSIISVKQLTEELLNASKEINEKI